MNVDTVERRLRKALLDRNTRLWSRKLDGETLAWVEYAGKAVEVVVDPMRGGLIECVVHELLHAVYAKELARWGDLEECIVVAVEKEVMAVVNNSTRRVRWWRDAITRKLGKEAE